MWGPQARPASPTSTATATSTPSSGNIDGNLNYFRNTGAGFTLVVDVTAQNDAAVLSADVRNLTETNAAADISTSGTLTISDVDSPATFVAQAGTAGSYGTFAIDTRRRLDLHRQLRAQRVRRRHHLYRHLLGRAAPTAR